MFVEEHERSEPTHFRTLLNTLTEGDSKLSAELEQSSRKQFPYFWQAYDEVAVGEPDEIGRLSDLIEARMDTSNLPMALRVFPSAVYYAYPDIKDDDPVSAYKKRIEKILQHSKGFHSDSDRYQRFVEKMQSGFPSTTLPWRYQWFRGLYTYFQEKQHIKEPRIADFGCSGNKGIVSAWGMQEGNEGLELTGERPDVAVLSSYMQKSTEGHPSIIGFDRQIIDEQWIIASAYDPYKERVADQLYGMIVKGIQSGIPTPAFQEMDLRRIETLKEEYVDKFDFGVASVALLYAGEFTERMKMLQTMLDCIKPGGMLMILDAKDVLEQKATQADLLRQLSQDGNVDVSVIIKGGYKDAYRDPYPYRRVLIGSLKGFGGSTPDAARSLRIRKGAFTDLDNVLQWAQDGTALKTQKGNILAMPDGLT